SCVNSRGLAFRTPTSVWWPTTATINTPQPRLPGPAPRSERTRRAKPQAAQEPERPPVRYLAAVPGYWPAWECSPFPASALSWPPAGLWQHWLAPEPEQRWALPRAAWLALSPPQEFPNVKRTCTPKACAAAARWCR